MVDRKVGGMPIAPDFVGLSYEKDSLPGGFFNIANEALIALLRWLGPGILRIGGNSVDVTHWILDGVGSIAGQIAPNDVDAFAAFLRAANWKTLYGLNFATNTPQRLAAEAAYAVRTLGDRLYGFEIGNEPDYYASNGLRPPNFTYDNFLAEWSAFADALSDQVPSAFLAGPGAAAFRSTWAVPFATAQRARIGLLTQHYYRGNGEAPDATLAQLLAGDPALPVLLQQLRQAATDNAVVSGFRLTEANSYSNRGAPNVSNAPGTALWVIDFLFLNARYGAAGVNPHGGGSYPGYTPIADDGQKVVEVRPEYYGMLLFSMAAQGELLATEVRAPGQFLAAYAVSRGASTHVVMVNHAADADARVAISLGHDAISATMMTLRAGVSGNAQGTTFGGASIGADASWSPEPPVTAAVVNGNLTVTVPPMSAMLVTAA